MALVDRTSYAGIVATEGARVSEIARVGPMQARVPHMRRWKLTDVVAHLGGVHRWAAEFVTTGQEPSGRRRGSAEGAALIDWFDEGVVRLVSLLAGADLDQASPNNFGSGAPATVEFWARRQAHETTIHRWDAEAAVGRITPIPPAFATDGIDELFGTFTSARGKQMLAAPVSITCTDTDAAWIVFPAERPGRVGFERGAGARSAVAAVSGPAEDLLLALWRRRTLPDTQLAVTGHAEAVEQFLSGPVTP